MKNKVLRLAIVAVIVVAMVLSMAACGKTPVNPTPSTSPSPSKSPDKTVGPTTKPTNPEISDDEAKLESKYGITFPVPDGMKVDFAPAVGGVVTSNLVVKDADGNTIKFGAKKPKYNDAFNAYGNFNAENKITVTAKVNGVSSDGKRVEIVETNLENADTWVTYKPTAAGTYTVVYTVKVIYDGETVFGTFKPAKINETYSVTKVYEVGKKSVTIESKSDAFEISKKLAYPVAKLYIDGQEQGNVQAVRVLEEMGLSGTDAKYNLSVDIVSADLTSYGTYPLNLVCVDSKNAKVDLGTLVSPNFEITFKNGNRYVLTDTELAAAVAAQDDVDAAAFGVKKEDIQLGVSTYSALVEAAKTWFLQMTPKLFMPVGGATPDNKTTLADNNPARVLAMNMNSKNLSRNGMADEALRLAKVWNDKLQNAEDGKAFVIYMLSISKDPVVIDGVPYETDYQFVMRKLDEASDKNTYIPKAQKLVAIHEKTVLSDFSMKYNAVIDATTKFAGEFDKATIENLTKKLASAQAAYDSLVAGQEKLVLVDGTAVTPTEPADSANEIIGDATLGDAGDPFELTNAFTNETQTVKNNFDRLVKVVSEVSARYTAYATLIDGLDPYIAQKATRLAMTRLLGYNFDTKKVSNNHADDLVEVYPLPTHKGQTEASWVMFDIKSVKADYKDDANYVMFSTPMMFVADAVKSQKVVVDAFVALEAAIDQAQRDVITNLGSKIKYAADDNVLVEYFDGTNFFNSGKDLSAAETDIKGTATPATGNLIKDITRLEALQAYIANEAIKAIYTEGVPFADLGKKDLAVLIANALKEPVNAVNDYIKDEAAFMFDFTVPAAGALTTLTLTNLFASYNMANGTATTAGDIIVTVYPKLDPTKPDVATSVAVTANSLDTITFALKTALVTGDVVEVVYNGITVSKTVA